METLCGGTFVHLLECVVSIQELLSTSSMITLEEHGRFSARNILRNLDTVSAYVSSLNSLTRWDEW